VSDHEPQIVSLALPQVRVDGGSYTADEGSSVPLHATANAPVRWDLDNDGVFETAGADATVPAGDGPATLTIPVEAVAADGTTVVSHATVTVRNVAPSATFDAPASVTATSPIALSLTAASDPSAADVAAGFQYAFDCGSGYGAFGSSPSVSCPTDDIGTRTVHGKIQDKDGGVTEYTATVQVTVTFQSLCNLTRSYSTKVQLADRLCGLLASAEADAISGAPQPKPKNPPRKPANKYLNRYVDQVNNASGSAFTSTQKATLSRLAQRLDDQYFAPTSRPERARTAERAHSLISRIR
jgi:hypothetical protein